MSLDRKCLRWVCNWEYDTCRMSWAVFFTYILMTHSFVPGCKHHQKDFCTKEVWDGTWRTNQVQHSYQVNNTGNNVEWSHVNMLTLLLNSLSVLTVPVPLFLSDAVRNRRSAQGDRLSAITMALQYESDEEGILSGTSSPHYLRFIKQTCASTGHWWRCYLQWIVMCHYLLISCISQVLSTMMRENLRQRVWPLTWTWVIPSSSCMRLCEVPGTARASWSLSLSCSCPTGKTTPTTTTRSLNPSASFRSSMTELALI